MYGSAWLRTPSAAMLAGLALAAGGVAIAPPPAHAQSYAGNEKPGAAELRNALRRLNTNPRDLDALIDAGTASLQLGDTNGAIDFFTRAEAIAPNNGDVKVGLATAMLRKENPVEAIRLFDEAERLGMPVRSFAMDRGLAYDLVGDFASAERQYQTAALSGPSDDITLRRGISLGVQGRSDESMKLMSPLLTKNDPGAWRAQAFIYAANGNMKDANDVAVSFLGEQKAQAMRPYFERMPLLTPAQKMAAIHFGHFPTTNIGQDSPQIAAMARAPSSDRLTPQGQPFGPAAQPAGTTQVAARTATPPKFKDFNGRPQKGVRYTPPVAQPASSPTPDPLPMPQPVQVASVPSAATPVATPTPTPVSTAGPAPVRVQPLPKDPPAQSSSVSASVPASAPLPTPANAASPGQTAGPAFASLPSRAPVSTPAAGLPSGYQPSVPVSASGELTLPPAGYSPNAGTYVDSQGVTHRIGEDGSVQPVGATPLPSASVASAPAPAGPAVIVPLNPAPQPVPQPLPQPTTSAEVILPPAVQPVATPTAAATAPQDRPALTDLVGSVAVPEEEKASNIVPVTPDVIASTPAAAPSPRVVTPKAETPKPAAKAPNAKASAPKAEAAKPAAKPAEKPAAAKHPKRHWVQIASGGDVAALRFDYRNAARKNPDLFKGLSGWTAPYGKTRRMVVGPFASAAEAQAWQKKYSAAGGQALVWQSAEGTVVEPLPTR